MVKVSFFGSFREAAGKKEIQLAATDMAELVKKIVSRYKAVAPLLLEKKRPLKLKEYNLILINGDGRWVLKGLRTKLKETDEVAFFPPVGGG